MRQVDARLGDEEEVDVRLGDEAEVDVRLGDEAEVDDVRQGDETGRCTTRR